MLKFHKSILCAAVVSMALAPLASAQSLTTVYARNNGGSLGGAVYFDVTVQNPGGLWVTSFDTNTAETVPMGLTVYVTPTTSVGNETNMGAWIEVAVGEGVGQGANNPTPVDTEDFLLPAGSYGIALVMASTAGHDYTNGNGSNQTYSNSDLTITCGTATNAPFTGNVFNPRVWNGTIYYSAAGNNVASHGRYGEGCQDSTGATPNLSANLPQLGNPFTITVDNLSAAVPAGLIVLGFSKDTFPGGSLPVDLTPIGAPGCSLLAAPLVSVFTPVSSGSMSLTLTLPTSTSLYFVRVYSQGIAIDPSANSLGVATSNGGEGTIGM